MIRAFITTIALLFMAMINCFACEICGCSNSNFQIGLLPNFSKGFVGFRYSASDFRSVLKSDPTQFSRDYSTTTEIWGGYNIKKIQVMAFVPYVSTRKESDDGTTVSQGLGDMLLMVNYKLFGTTGLSKNEKVTVLHELYMGGGIKLPTGVGSVDMTNPDFNIGDFNSQAGTGSVDYLINATHNYLWNKSGIVTNIAYRINSVNQQGYRFGNRSYLNTAYYYTFTKGEIKIKPSAGFNYQGNAINTFAGDVVADSNGYVINGTAAVNILYRKVGIYATAFLPLIQNQYDGQTKLQSRSLFGITYSF